MESEASWQKWPRINLIRHDSTSSKQVEVTKEKILNLKNSLVTKTNIHSSLEKARVLQIKSLIKSLEEEIEVYENILKQT